MEARKGRQRKDSQQTHTDVELVKAKRDLGIDNNDDRG